MPLTRKMWDSCACSILSQIPRHRICSLLYLSQIRCIDPGNQINDDTIEKRSLERWGFMKKIIILLLGLLILTGCSKQNSALKGDGEARSFHQISQDQAKEMIEKEDGHIIVDVRRQDEYDAGHIPGAVLIPNESIGTERPEKLTDLDQIIMVYCRSGNRSKQAAEKLFRMGYTNVYEFGGINTWTGEIVTEENEKLEQEKTK